MDVWSLFYSLNLGIYNMKIRKHDLSANLGRGALVSRPRFGRRSPQMRSSHVPDALKAIEFKSATAVPPLMSADHLLINRSVDYVKEEMEGLWLGKNGKIFRK